ncbi:hypothetical protein CDN99_06535 [Roseateles aquatilis]|uniref:Uncharacterized protein n=1 Tax=Roseateles aquatilis TaxID=431061 RepID=A0A246JID4_9BURK|nr:hypothetical protein CDN99_06535 [Roseateles aquatilis]
MAVASVRGGAAGWAQLEGLTYRAFIVCAAQPVHQPVQPSHFLNPFKEATLQHTLPLLGRIDAPSVVPPSLLKHIRCYRAAVRLCWALRRAKGLRVSDLGRDHGFTRQHVSDYLNDDDLPTRRSLPAEQIHLFEDVCGNTAITQWLAGRHRFTLLEELQAERALA